MLVYVVDHSFVAKKKIALRKGADWQTGGGNVLEGENMRPKKRDEREGGRKGSDETVAQLGFACSF